LLSAALGDRILSPPELLVAREEGLSVTETTTKLVEAVALISAEDYRLAVRSPVLLSYGGYR
jgi:hypothetical protein